MSRSETINDTRSENNAKKFRLYKWIVLAFLVVFLLFGLILFENDITVENLRYLIRYLDFSGAGSYSEETVIHYNADSANRFHVFRGDLARVNEKSVTLYDRKGTAVMTDSFNMSNPVAVCGEKYLVVYDLGGHQLRVYNSFSLLYETSFDYLLQSVSVNSDGYFCVVTSEKSYHSAVFVYDEDFKQIQQWFSSDKFAVDAALSDSNVLTVSTVRVEEGALAMELVELKVGKKDQLSSYTLMDQMPLTHTTDRAGTLLVTNESIRYVKNGEEVRSAAVPKGGLEQIRFGEKLCVAVQDELMVGVNFRLRVFDREANEVQSHRFSVPIRDIEIWDDTVYVLTHTSLFRIRPGEEMKEFSLAGDYSDLGVLSRDVVILCSDTAANIRILD